MMTGETVDNLSPIQRKEIKQSLETRGVTISRSGDLSLRGALLETLAQSEQGGPQATPAGKIPDALSKMLNKAPRLTGEDSDDPEERLIFCQNACRVVQGPREAQIECTILTLRGYAPCMWTTAMKGADYTSPIVFTVLRNHLHGLAGEQLRMSEFRMLRFDDSMRGTTLEAFKPLIAKAQRLQRRLSVEMQCEEVLVTTLQGAAI
ncbi:hypothetical protein FVE85_0170 [Porphyridium purpureum]|uniref:Uncharacterized protein n=1 Tax=Porphyridium purpureum TaxID=35688 RepID=A0A5J4YXX0_PORPP|nr:hypothetical protein FVE85_0170 [Porphyridium purpureum]|eukprot:POR3732..scf208_2